ncbi:tetratricopeptide repeat protein [Granulicella aggregans]|uniref:tetratricopeptide repeat protein n=1 Tax=Granulicella aggregans TaxID=474949 RepID=UPI0021E0E5C9|nr:hypothetical protein [Granulicella aggregans]
MNCNCLGAARDASPVITPALLPAVQSIQLLQGLPKRVILFFSGSSPLFIEDMTGVLELQSEVTRDIAKQIRVQLSHEEKADLTRVRPVNPETEDLYLRGKERFFAGDQKTAFTCIKKAVLSDPNYAPAHAALAQCFGWPGSSGLMPRSEGFAQQYAEARKALELDESLPQAHIELGYVAMSQGWNWDVQGREFFRAVQLDTSLAVAHEAYSECLLRLGRISERLLRPS